MLLVAICQRPHFQIVMRTTGEIKNDPKFYGHTLFSKRNASFKKFTEFALVKMGFQLFCDFAEETCAQTFQNCKRTIRNFGLGSFASYSQDHLTKST